jgi:hypothetical protein
VSNKVTPRATAAQMIRVFRWPDRKGNLIPCGRSRVPRLRGQGLIRFSAIALIVRSFPRMTSASDCQTGPCC